VERKSKPYYKREGVVMETFLFIMAILIMRFLPIIFIVLLLFNLAEIDEDYAEEWH
jgi:hypothetical protein